MSSSTWFHNLWVDLKFPDWIVAIFTVVLAVIAYFQYCEMRDGGKDTHTLAQAALTQANLSQETFDAIFHPNVEVSRVSYDQVAITDDGAISYTLKNVGSAPAERFTVRVTAQIGSAKKDLSPAQPQSELGVGATYVGSKKLTDSSGTAAVLNGRVPFTLSFNIQYEAHGKAPAQFCNDYTFEPAKRELIPTGSCK